MFSALDLRTMSHKKKICVVVLGTDPDLKKALTTIILGKDVIKTKVLINTEIHENNTYEVICTPDLKRWCNDTREVFAINGNPDMSLLVVKEWFSAEEVWKQIELLHKLTGKPTEEFMVVLPLSHIPTQSYPFRWCTMDELFLELRRRAQEKPPMMPNMSHADHPEPGVSTSYTPMEVAGKHSDTRVNLVLVGMSGSGKSASGNTMLGRPYFTSRVSSHLITKECHWTDTVIRGRPVRVIDTPDIFDEEINPTVKNQHVKKCRELCQVGPSVFLLVMHVSRFTDGERDVLRKMEEAFGSRVHEQTIILFTREGDLKQGEKSFENFLRSSTADLKKIIKKCGNRCVIFENKASCPQQVERLMQTVDQMLKQ